MTTIETKSSIALLLTLAAATVGVRGAAYADSSAGGQVEAVTSAPSLPATVPPSDSSLRYSLPWRALGVDVHLSDRGELHVWLPV